MIKRLEKITKSELFIGSLVLMILINIGNVINYVFHFSMAKMLGPIDYGILAVLTNIIYIFGVPTLSLQTLVSKQTTKLRIKNETGKIKSIFNYLLKETILIGIIIYALFLILSFFLMNYLGIKFSLLALTGLFIFPALLYPISVGVLQGTKRFKVWGYNYIISCTLKLIIAVVLVLIGFQVYGAMLGFILGVLIGFFLIFPFIKDILNSKEIKEKINIFSENNLTIFFAILIIVLIYSVDVIIVKIIFSPKIAGQYAVASLIGKMILFSTSAIGSAMFPISSEKFESGNKSRSVIKKTFLGVIFICTIAILILFLIPELILKILMLNQYIEIAKVLGYVGIAFSFISLLNIFILYKISVERFYRKHLIYLILFFILEIVIMINFSGNIDNFSIGFMFSSIISFIGSLILIRK